jgi:hypothetical protein
MEDGMLAQREAQALGIASIVRIGPPRSAPMCGGVGHIREFDGIAFGTGSLYRLAVGVLAAGNNVVAFNTGIDTARWTEFIVPCISFIASINLVGGTPLTAATLQAVLDPQKSDQVEFRIVNPDRTTAPITAMPLYVGKIEVFNIDHSIRTGHIGGVGVAIGSHSIASLT